MNPETWKNSIKVVLIFALIVLLSQESKAQQVSWYSTDQGFTSTVHKEHVKEVIWSKAVISYNDVENAVLESRFKLTDPIYGRIYLKQSVRNTPVYSSVNDKPIENSKNSFEWKLYIDGKDTGGSFGVFYEAYLNDDMGKNWTTWQFSPHMSNPGNSDEDRIVSAWEKAVRGLGAGEHAVRFELWGVSGTHRTSEPMAIGKFILVVPQGERLATTAKFPEQTYSGNDAAGLSKQIKSALISNGKASSSEIKKVAITGNWVYNRYTDSKKEYRKISAAVLFADKDNDGVCRFVTYNFISDKNSNGWTAPRFHSFCNGCPEGDVNCSD